MTHGLLRNRLWRYHHIYECLDRYHRQPNDAVLRELSALRLPDGTAAVGNHLWLTLALDLLNQLDADDFTEAESATGGSAEAQLRQIVLQRARTLPPDVEGLYRVLLRRVGVSSRLALRPPDAGSHGNNLTVISAP